MSFKFRNPPVAVWLIPLTYAAGALFVGFTVPRRAYSILPGYVSRSSQTRLSAFTPQLLAG
jgi:hypothetical protein